MNKYLYFILLSFCFYTSNSQYYFGYTKNKIIEKWQGYKNKTNYDVETEWTLLYIYTDIGTYCYFLSNGKCHTISLFPKSKYYQLTRNVYDKNLKKISKDKWLWDIKGQRFSIERTIDKKSGLNYFIMER